MAVSAIAVTLGVDLGEGKFNSSIGYAADPVAAVTTQAALLVTAKAKVVLAQTASDTVVANAVSYAALAATFATALGVCVSDGASPTQAHVTTANTAYTALAAAYDTLSTDITTLDTAVDLAVTDTNLVTLAALTTALGSNVIVLIDTAVITTGNAYKWAIQKALQAAKNVGIVAP